MYLLALVIAAFIPQEFATTAIVVVYALQNNFPIWAVNAIWICTTLFDMYVGYSVGALVKKRFHNTRAVNWIERRVEKIKRALGTHGEKLGVTIIGIINFPYLNAFLASWLDIPMELALALTFIGNFIWFLVLWATVLGLSAFVSNPDIIILILAVVGILSHVLLKFLKPKKDASATGN